jgi:hypothetical protein
VIHWYDIVFMVIAFGVALSWFLLTIEVVTCHPLIALTLGVVMLVATGGIWIGTVLLLEHWRAMLVG